jgi:hypothetical protein
MVVWYLHRFREMADARVREHSQSGVGSTGTRERLLRVSGKRVGATADRNVKF